MPATASAVNGNPHNQVVRAFMRAARLNRSPALDAVLGAFRNEPDREFQAVDFMKEANVPPGSLFRLLDKLVRTKCVEVVRVGSPRPVSTKRYKLTDAGARFVLRYFNMREG